MTDENWETDPTITPEVGTLRYFYKNTTEKRA